MTPENEQFCIPPNATPLTNLTLLKLDYARAEVTSIYLRRKDPGGWNKLLFEVIELLPGWTESGTTKDIKKRLGGSSDHSIHFRRVHCSVEDALNRYERYRRAQEQHIPQTDKELSAGISPFPLSVQMLGEEPSWPQLFCEPDSDFFWKKSPFWGFRPGGVRRHQLLALDADSPLDGLSPRERKELEAVLAELLPFELLERPLLMGSCHFILPNPLFAAVEHRFQKGSPTKMSIRIRALPGADITTLKAIFREIRPGGLAQLFEVPISDSIFTIDFGYEPHEVGFEVLCSKRGVLFSSKPSTFIRSININMRLVTGTKKVFVPSASSLQSGESYSVPIVGHQQTTVSGEPAPLSATLVVLKDRLGYQEKAAVEGQQSWFNDVEQAKKRIRELIGGASSLVRIVDPYFALRELQSFALATSSTSARIEILSSAVHLNSKGFKSKKGIELFHQLGSLQKQGLQNTFDVRVMPGSKPSIHDRFIQVDETVWLLGSSLNEFGSRGTMMVKLHHPDQVRAEIMQTWDMSAKLEEFVKGKT